jgi:hypothetical protein
MISTLNNRAGTGEDTLFRGVRRSRFSLHFTTPGTRRSPVQATTEWLDGIAQRLNRERKQSSPNLATLFDQYQLDTTLRRTI